MAKRREWVLRCMYENEDHDSSVFLTITYSNDNLPPGNKLVKRDLQNYIKRLRHLVPPFKYFACGEKGDRFGRPHFHLIMFGLSEMHKEYMNIAWEKGFTYLGEVNVKSIQYVSKYLDKKALESAKNNIDGRSSDLSIKNKPYFMVCSKGLGLQHARRIVEQMIVHGVTLNGVPMSIPRYFHKKLELPEGLRKDEIDRRESDLIYKITGLRFKNLEEFYGSRKYRVIEYYNKVENEKNFQKSKNVLAKIRG